MTPQIALETNDISGELSEFLVAHTRETIGENAIESFQFSARDDNGDLLGGITGGVSHGVLSVQLLALAARARRLGLGSRLLKTLEDAAREKGATVSRVDTLEFEAPDFYQKQGYEIFGIVGDQIGRRTVFLSKSL